MRVDKEEIKKKERQKEKLLLRGWHGDEHFESQFSEAGR